MVHSHHKARLRIKRLEPCTRARARLEPGPGPGPGRCRIRSPGTCPCPPGEVRARPTTVPPCTTHTQDTHFPADLLLPVVSVLAAVSRVVQHRNNRRSQPTRTHLVPVQACQPLLLPDRTPGPGPRPGPQPVSRVPDQQPRHQLAGGSQVRGPAGARPDQLTCQDPAGIGIIPVPWYPAASLS